MTDLVLQWDRFVRATEQGDWVAFESIFAVNADGRIVQLYVAAF